MSVADLGRHHAARAARASAALETVLRELVVDERTTESSAWMAQSVCAQTDPEAFFPEKGGSVRTVLAICGRCPVRTQCLDFALENNIQHGIWGGLSSLARRRLQQRTA